MSLDINNGNVINPDGAMGGIIERLGMGVTQILGVDEHWKEITSILTVSIEKAISEFREKGFQIPDLLEEGNIAPDVYENLVARVVQLCNELKEKGKDNTGTEIGE